jgi:primosomal replication protein N
MNYAPQSEQTKARNAEKRRLYLERSARIGRSLLNKVIIEGFLVDQEERRYTASGLPVIKFRLLHLGQQDNQVTSQGHESKRQVVCTMNVLCIGDSLCKQLVGMSEESLIRVEGFLSRNAYKDELSWVVLEAQTIAVIELLDND